MTAVRPLAELRVAIDAIDHQILTLINQRAELALEVAQSKTASGESECFYRPEREAAVLRRMQASNPGPLDDTSVIRLYRELMSACLALEKPLTVAFLGPSGTYSQQASYKHFGHAVETCPQASISEVFRAVETDHCRYGVVPVENSSEGVIADTLDCFVNTPLPIIGEVELPIHHNLMSQESHLSTIKTVYSHPQSLAQCRRWLQQYVPQAKLSSLSSNAEAARVASNNPGTAAIAGEMAAELYQLTILEKNIEDQTDNTTRFLVIGKQQVASTDLDKTSLLVSMGNQPGALVQTLEPLSTHGISMTKIESRPSRYGMWDYVFFIDIEGHHSDAQVSQALSALKKQANLLKILGSYPRVLSSK